MSVVLAPDIDASTHDHDSDDEFCHIICDTITGATYCGQSGDGGTPTCREYDGEEICPTCQLPTCPTCMVMAELDDQLGD